MFLRNISNHLREISLCVCFVSMYSMCVCLFSALSHRVGALQISIIIIINNNNNNNNNNNRELMKEGGGAGPSS